MGNQMRAGFVTAVVGRVSVQGLDQQGERGTRNVAGSPAGSSRQVVGRLQVPVCSVAAP